MRDAFSRFVLVLRVMPSTRERDVRVVFEELFRRYGLPKAIQSVAWVGGEEQDLRSRSDIAGRRRSRRRAGGGSGSRPAGGRDDHGGWSAARCRGG